MGVGETGVGETGVGETGIPRYVVVHFVRSGYDIATVRCLQVMGTLGQSHEKY